MTGPSVNLDEVEVRPPGVAPLRLVVRGLPVRASLPPTAGAPIEVEVRGVLEFRGTARVLPFRLASRVRAAHGILDLSPDADLLALRSHRGEVRADLSVGWGDARVHDVELPCAAVEMGYHLPPERDPEILGDGTSFRPREGHLVFHARPGSSRRLRVEFRREVSFSRLETRGPWLLLRYTGPDGSVIQGWVEQATVERGPAILVGGARDYGGYPACGVGHAEGPDLEFGPATLTPGTQVFAERGRGPWATVVRAEPVVAMRTRGDAWTRLVTIQGLSEAHACDPFTHAWVPSGAVRFIPGARATARPDQAP